MPALHRKSNTPKQRLDLCRIYVNRADELILKNKTGIYLTAAFKLLSAIMAIQNQARKK
jgi:hypothetical protein